MARNVPQRGVARANRADDERMGEQRVENALGPARLGPQQGGTADHLHLGPGEIALQFLPVARADRAVVVEKDDDFAGRARQGGVALPGRVRAQRDEDLHPRRRRDLPQAGQRGFGIRETRHGDDDRVAQGHRAWTGRAYAIGHAKTTVLAITQTITEMAGELRVFRLFLSVMRHSF